jgi:hypothetical protein
MLYFLKSVICATATSPSHSTGFFLSMNQSSRVLSGEMRPQSAFAYFVNMHVITARSARARQRLGNVNGAVGALDASGINQSQQIDHRL